MKLFALLAVGAALAQAQSAANVLLVVNSGSADSRQVGEYYRAARTIPAANICRIRTTDREEILRKQYDEEIEAPIAACLKMGGMVERILYIVTTLGVPLKINAPGGGMQRESASVDSELTLLYPRLKGQTFPAAGGVPNPFFGNRGERFSHPRFGMYMVTRLAAYDVATVKAMIDRCRIARNVGQVVLDLSSPENIPGNSWLRDAAIRLPANRVILDQTSEVVLAKKNVIGYASWGSNDMNRTQRWLRFQWMPGAIAMEYVSSSARTLARPPETWTIGRTWDDKNHLFAGTAQGMSADLLQEGASGASGNVYEPFLGGCVHPEMTLPAYLQGRNLAESYYLGMPMLSWMGVIFGDPLCALAEPKGGQ